MRSSNLALLVAAACMVLPQAAVASDVVEVVTLKLKNGVSYADFAPIDKAVETQHVSKQPGFISRESAAGENGEWLVIIHWRRQRTRMRQWRVLVPLQPPKSSWRRLMRRRWR